MRNYIITDSPPKLTNHGMEKSLLTVNMGEIAYYIDRRNARKAYVEA